MLGHGTDDKPATVIPAGLSIAAGSSTLPLGRMNFWSVGPSRLDHTNRRRAFVGSLCNLSECRRHLCGCPAHGRNQVVQDVAEFTTFVKGLGLRLPRFGFLLTGDASLAEDLV